MIWVFSEPDEDARNLSHLTVSKNVNFFQSYYFDTVNLRNTLYTLYVFYLKVKKKMFKKYVEAIEVHLEKCYYLYFPTHQIATVNCT